MKKKLTIIALIITSAILLTSCGVTSYGDEKPFIGTFASDWIEGSNGQREYLGMDPITYQSYYAYYLLSYALTMNKDRTFVLKIYREYPDETATKETVYNGTWAGNTSKDTFGIICFYESEGSHSSEIDDSVRGQYITLTSLDDGRIIASSGIDGFPGISAGYTVVLKRK